MSNLDWSNLGFAWLPVNGYVHVTFTNGCWSDVSFVKGSEISLSVAANVFHYGQACFEGLKAFTAKSGTVSLFRPKENYKRLQKSAQRLCMTAPSEEIFLEACRMAISKNKQFIPPYGMGASLYVRPILIGTEAMIGISSSKNYSFMVMVTPVGPYYTNGFKPIKARIVEEYDRAAARGTGNCKVAGNYAASLIGNIETKKQGLEIDLYTDSITHQYIDEFATSNFIGLTANKEYHTPNSASILPSIINDCLQQIAKNKGFSIYKRQIAIEELSVFQEVGACGTAAMITPICSIQNQNQKWSFGSPTQASLMLRELSQSLFRIQYGEVEDRLDWLYPIHLK